MFRSTIVACVLVILAGSAYSDEAVTARECVACGQAIDGGYFETNGRYFHPDHFRCKHCDERIDGPYTEYKGANYHNNCFRDHVALRCDLCGGVIQGEYIIDFWGNGYHLHHQGDAPSCDSCSRFISPDITGGGVRYDDGRYICNICRDASVKNVEEVIALMDEVATHLRALGVEVDYRGMQVHLIGREEMQDRAGRHSQGLRGFTDYSEDWRVFGRARNRRIDMYFLYAMPRMELISTIAHELMHVYQFNHGRFQNDPAWSEGSCNYAAWLVLGKYPGRDGAFFRANLVGDPDAVYGDGFRRVKDYAESAGAGAWLKRVRKDGRFPSR